jgi:hypothetical protein
MWNHGLAEVMTSLLNNNLVINSFEEHDYFPYNCFKHTTEHAPKKFRISHLDNKIPMVLRIDSYQENLIMTAYLNYKFR